MAKKNSAVLWTVGQSLAKGDKEQARHNMGINFESSTPPTTNTLTFVDDIKENATTGDLTFTKQNVTVESAVSSSSNNPVSGKAVSTAISNIEFMKTGTTDPSTTPTKLGIHYRNTVTGEVWIATGTSSASDWKLLSDRIHVLMNQHKIIYISGEGSNTPILCDKFNYTIGANNSLVFTPVSPEQAYIWVNRGDFIVFDSCADNDPWGDSYWMQQVEVQSDTALKEVTNFAFTRVTARQIFHTWFNPITDSSTNTKYFTNNGTIDEKEIGDGHLKFKFGNYYDVFDTGFNANSTSEVIYEMPLAGNKYGITKLLKYPSPAPSDWNTFYDSNDTAVTPTYVSHYVESNFFRKREANNPKWNSVRHQDSPSESAFWFITNSATPDASNESPESGALYLISGGAAKTNTTGYRTQLAMGNHLYYRHTTGNGNSSWSDWITYEYSAGTDLVLHNNEFAVNTDSAIDDLSEAKRGFAIGEGNYMYNSDRSFLGGTQSYMYGGNSVFLFGDYCHAGDEPSDVDDPSTYSTLSYAFVYGNTNTVASSNCLVVLGENNSIGKYNDTITASGLKHGHNVIIGDNNNISGGKYNICMGSHNRVSFNQAQNSPSYTIMLGHDLAWNNPVENDLLILGRYNDTTYRYRSTGIHPVRITGCGTDSSGANIEELYPSGILWLQTGVEMHKTTGSFNYDSQLFMDRDGYASLTISLAAQESVSGNDPDYSYTRKITDMGYVKRDSIGISAVTEITDIIADGGATIPSNSLQNVQLLNIKRPSKSPSGNLDYTNACTLEFQDSVRCGVMGFAVSEPAIPSWNSAILSDLANSWFRIYANRIDPGHPDVIKMPWEAIAGNLELGKLAVKFFSEDDFTQAHPLVPGAKVGDLTFITGNGDDTTSSHTFWVQDSSHNGQPYQVANYIKANTFCILATRVASNFNTNPYTLGSFTALVSQPISD